MACRVAFLECTGDLWLDIAQTMQRERAWEPVYWSGGYLMQADVVRRFPDVTFHENTRAVKGLPPDCGARLDLPPLDESILAAMRHAEGDALIMMDRMDPDGTFDFRARRELYRRHLQFGLAMLNEIRPDIIVNAAVPHLVYDYVIYQLCRLRNIRSIIFVETAVDGIIFPSPTYEDAPDQVIETYERLRDSGYAAALSTRAEQYWQKLQGEYKSAAPAYVIAQLEERQHGRAEVPAEHVVPRQMAELATRIAARPARTPDGGTDPTQLSLSGLPIQLARKAVKPHARPRILPPFLRTTARRLIQRFIVLLEAGSGKSGLRNFLAVSIATRRLLELLAQTGRSADPISLRIAMNCALHYYRALETEFPRQVQDPSLVHAVYLKNHALAPQESQFLDVEYWLYRLMAARKKRAMLEQYHLIAQPVEVSQPYIYVALHYQPECSTSPLAGVYVDQYLIVEMVSKIVPQGWLVYVRENPLQFHKVASGELSRSLDFYRKLGELPNVRLTSVDMSPFELVDGAKAVATGTGTTGWEAVARGVPTLAFGLPWYLRCEGVFSVAKLEDCREALRKIAEGFRPDRAKVKLFLQALEEFGFRGYTIPDLLSAANVTPQQNVRGFVEALKRYDPAVAAGRCVNLNLSLE